MKTVWKFPFEVTDIVEIKMPFGAVPLHVAVQDGTPFIWALVEEQAPKVIRCFRVSGTGHILPATIGRYIGSFMCMGGVLVYHVFEWEAR